MLIAIILLIHIAFFHLKIALFLSLKVVSQNYIYIFCDLIYNKGPLLPKYL